MKWKPFMVLGAILFVVTLIIPSLLVIPFMEKVNGRLGEASESPIKTTEASPGPSVDVVVYRTGKKDLEKVPLEEYVAGVVAAEMPAEFEEEALKAQALTARTYIVKQMLSESKLGLPEGAMVLDTTAYQVYKNKDELRRQWGTDYKWKMDKIETAVKTTAGKILTYEGAPIDATFFSTSNGYTENSDAIWTHGLPYLTSVESPWDKKSPKFEGQKVIPKTEFEQKLGVKLTDEGTIGKVVSRTAGKRVAIVNINGKEISGKDIREKLALKSTDFDWKQTGNQIIITTKGYGHGVGMSQYGANGMAKEGNKYEDIVKYYYKGIEVSQSDSLLSKVVAKK
ncbi:stage II sporulation protein D [Bacillus sp. 03113]|uniref:stage II sporulation protein D n=1 Tax=Bacillus sp. 03113 TaxID=2578211 RepID=UPI00215CC6B7|nr:stage II sporulation protein D [Bacillus sp. 03113]